MTVSRNQLTGLCRLFLAGRWDTPVLLQTRRKKTLFCLYSYRRYLLEKYGTWSLVHRSSGRRVCGHPSRVRLAPPGVFFSLAYSLRLAYFQRTNFEKFFLKLLQTLCFSFQSSTTFKLKLVSLPDPASVLG
jgi:hypothetical protein